MVSCKNTFVNKLYASYNLHVIIFRSQEFRACLDMKVDNHFYT